MNESVTSANRYLLVKGAAGMGNRLCCAASGLLYARLTGRRLYIDWNDGTYTDDNSNAFPFLFNPGPLGMEGEMPDAGSIYPSVWRGRLRNNKGEVALAACPSDAHGPAAWRRTSANLARLDYPQSTVVFWSYTEQIHRFRSRLVGQFPEWRGRSVEQILGQTLRNNFRLAAPIQAQVKQFRESRLPGPSVGVHVRYTDKKTSLPRIEEMLSRTLKRESPLAIYLATDSEEVVTRFRLRYPKVVTAPRQYGADGRPAHHPASGTRRLEHGVETLVDLYLLAGCDYLVLDDRSTFSYLAHLLSNSPEDRIVSIFRRSRLHPRVRHVLWMIKRTLRKALFGLPPPRVKPLPEGNHAGA